MTAPQPDLALAIRAQQHAALQAHLFPGDGKEAVAVLLCGRGSGLGRETLVVRDVVPVPYESCRIRTPVRVTWPPEAVVPALTRAMNEGLAVVKVHSHPGGQDEFSVADNESDLNFFSSVSGWLDSDAGMASLVMLPDGRLFGRAVSYQGIGRALQSIRVTGDDFVFWHREQAEQVPQHAVRIAQMFGEATYRRLRALRVGVVGCSGTGSIVIEQLIRNCVGELVVVDPDHIEDRNLNRILNSTRRDAEQATLKTAVVKRTAEAVGLGSIVTEVPGDILDREVITALASCDVVFGCVDSVDGRHFLNKISSYYLIPYIDVGVRIDADGHGGVEQVCAAVHTILPGGSSLMSRGVYGQDELNAAMMKRYSPDLYAQRLSEGYVRGAKVDQPAVISVNMLAASMAINEFLARIHPYRVSPNSDFAIRRFSLSDPIAGGDEPDGESCRTFGACLGLGDQLPLLGVMEVK
ncbi:ThiF family adenylyltransferase [Ralstonia pseudosolanacearum]